MSGTEPDLVQAHLDSQPLEVLHEFARRAAARFRDGHELTRHSRTDSDQALTWVSGLMGAGIFSVHAVLAGAPTTMRLTALIPWAAGIVLAVLSRLVAGTARVQDDRLHFERLAILDLLETLALDRALVAKTLREVLRSGEPSRPEVRRLNRLIKCTEAAFYLSHIGFAVGAIGAVMAVTLSTR